jgi:hypothetical protein
MSEFPVVAADDPGIRPAGAPDECFYCRSKVGAPHGDECVMVTKRVRLRYTFEVELDVPHSWSVDNILFHRNEGTWCSRNALYELEKAYPSNNEAPCPCPGFKCEFLAEVDSAPTMRSSHSKSGDA